MFKGNVADKQGLALGQMDFISDCLNSLNCLNSIDSMYFCTLEALVVIWNPNVTLIEAR